MVIKLWSNQRIMSKLKRYFKKWHSPGYLNKKRKKRKQENRLINLCFVADF